MSNTLDSIYQDAVARVPFKSIDTGNVIINFSKRIAAEAGNIAANIYDPYEKKSKKAALGSIISGELSKLAANSKDFKLEIGEDGYLKAHLNISQYDNNSIIRSAFKFDYQPYDENKLDILRKKYRLGEKVNSAKNEFEKIILIREWLNSYLKFGMPRNVSYNFNALDILGRTEKGAAFFCSEYATTYIQLLASIGITARHVGLFKGHAVSEVWSDDYGKWLIMDPTYNIYYEKDGIPLNALELHNLWVNNEWKEVKLVMGRRNKEIEKYPYRYIDHYADFFIRMRNDWLTNKYPRWHPKSNSIMNGLKWSDAYAKNDIRVANKVNKIEDLFWQLNRVHIKFINYEIIQDKVILKLYLDTVTPNFSEFLIKFDQGETAIHTANPIFDWKLETGLNVLEVTPFNKFGIKGKTSIISIDYK